MEAPKYLQILWSYKWLLLFGLLVSLVAGLLAGFTIKDGELESRVQSTYRAANTIMLSSKNPYYFQTQVLPDVIDPNVQTTEQPVQVSLSDAALIYAYLVSSLQIRALVEQEIGPLSEDEQIVGQARTSQPGEEAATSASARLSLPMLDVIGVAQSPVRAEEISEAANKAFITFVSAQQDEQAIPDDLRVVLTTLSAPVSDAGVGSNPWIPVAVAFLGSMAGFVALAFLLFAGQKTTQLRRERKRRREAEQQQAVTDDGVDDESDGEQLDEQGDTVTADSENARGERTRRRTASHRDSSSTLDGSGVDEGVESAVRG